jgi:hypothetical protein
MDIYEQCKTDSKQINSLKVDNVLDSLDKKDSESLKKALLDTSISSRAIARVLHTNNIDCGMWAINQWRRAHNIKLKTSSSYEGKK